MTERFPENNKRAGVFYATSSDGLELPVIDVTHPAFELHVSEEEQRAQVKEFLHHGIPFSFLPASVRKKLLQILLRGSRLAEGIQKSQGGFMTGLDTYLLKIGPEMLGEAYANSIDRKIAAALPSLGVRLRLQDVAQLMADALAPALASQPTRPVHFLNIGGGPAIDSLNALLLLKKRNSDMFAERRVFIDVLDLDQAGPAFGKAALNSLSDKEGPLHAWQISFRHLPYNWARPEDLKPVMSEVQGRGSLAICSSEGGLFEYGSDEEIQANLGMLRSLRELVAVVGSVTRADEASQRLQQTNRASLRPRGLAVFRELVKQVGWDVARAIERPFSDQVLLT